jgi:hypothetical protein
MANRRPVQLVLAALLGVTVAAVGAAIALALVVMLGGRSSSPDDPRNGVDADTARFTYGDRSVEVPLVACGRDGDIVIMAGRRGPIVIQVWADLGEGGRDRTGVTADLGDDGIMGAFGPDIPPGPAGTIVSVRTVGDGLVVEGRWAMFDTSIEPVEPGSPGNDHVDTLVARCPPDGESDEVA